MNDQYVGNINDTNFDDYNNGVAAFISIIANSILIYATSKVKVYARKVKQMQIISCTVRLLFSLVCVLGSPTIAYVKEVEAVYFVKGGFYLPIEVGKIVLCLFIVFIIFSCLGPPVQFSQVLYIVSKAQPIKSTTRFLPYLLGILTGVFVIIAYSPTENDKRLSDPIIYYINGEGNCAYLIASIKSDHFQTGIFTVDIISLSCTAFILSILICSTIVVIICYLKINRRLKRSSNISQSSIKSQKHLCHSLLVQFLLPFITVHLSMYVSFLMPLFNIELLTISIYLPYLFSWCPALNPIIVILMVKSIRDQMMRISGSKSPVHSSAFPIGT